MSALDWRKAKHGGKRRLSTADEAEFRDKDAAARWLARNEKTKSKPHAKPSRAIPARHQTLVGERA